MEAIKIPVKPVVTLQALGSMKPEEARVLIARDALALLDSEAVFAKTGAYVLTYTTLHDLEPYAFSFADLLADKPEEGDRQVRDVVESFPVCGACALGTAFLASVRRFNDLTVQEAAAPRCRGEMEQYLTRFFDSKQLDAIEWAFEGEGSGDKYKWEAYRELRPSIEAYVALFPTPAMRLRNIFQNIIANKGTFVLPVYEDASSDDDEDDAVADENAGGEG
jgi:hypothetical protein